MGEIEGFKPQEPSRRGLVGRLRSSLTHRETPPVISSMGTEILPADLTSTNVTKTHIEGAEQEFIVPGESIEKYSTVKEGALTYIVDEFGRKVSEGYHSYELFTSTNLDGIEIKGLIGRIGGIKLALRLPTEEDPTFRPSREAFHDIEYRPDLGGIFVVKTGSLCRIIDNEGRSITDGYHTISMRDGKLYGKKGAKEEEIVLRYTSQGHREEVGHYSKDNYPTYKDRRDFDIDDIPGERFSPTRHSRKSSSDLGRKRRDEDYPTRRGSGNSNDFFTARDVTKPFWEREAALDRMNPRSAEFWSKDVTLPSWVRNKYRK